MHRRAFLRSVGASAAVGSVGAALSSPVAGHGTPDGTPVDPSGTPVGTGPLGTLSLPGAKEAVLGDDGDTAFVATTDGFATVDLRDPAAPERLARQRVLPDRTGGPLGGVWDVAVDGDRLLVAGPAHGGVGGLHAAVCFDVGDPATPERVAVHETEYPIHNCALADGVAYLTANGAPGNPLVTADAATGAELGRWSLVDRDDAWREVPPSLRTLHDVTVHGDTAVLAHWDAGTWLLDVSDPAAPSLRSRVRGRSPGTLAAVDEPGRENTELPGNDHFATLDASGTLLGVGLEAWDADGDGAKTEAHAGDPDASFGADGSADDGAVFGADESDAGTGTPRGEAARESATRASPAVDGAPGAPGPILLYDVADPADPRYLSRIAPPPSSDATRGGVWTTAHNFAFVDDRLYSAWYQGGVRVHDVSDPAAPRPLFRWRDAERAKFWTAQRGPDGDFFLGASMAAPGEDDRGAGLFTFADPPDDASVAAVSGSGGADGAGGFVPTGDGLGAVGALTGAAVGALGLGAWRRRRRD